MKPSEKKRIENFAKSIDYRDICYFIEHVPNLTFRNSLLEELGYKVGVEVVKEEGNLYKIYFSKNTKKLKMQISEKLKGINLAYCIILEKF